MGAHLIEGQFQSDKYPTTPPGKVPLSVKDETAQDLLWEYARRRRNVDAEFADDLEAALRSKGYDPSNITDIRSPEARLARIAVIIEIVDQRAMAYEGPVPPTLQEMTQEEISRIYALAKGKPESWRP